MRTVPFTVSPALGLVIAIVGGEAPIAGETVASKSNCNPISSPTPVSVQGTGTLSAAANWAVAAAFYNLVTAPAGIAAATPAMKKMRVMKISPEVAN